MFETSATRRSFVTSDGVTLSYLEAGAGPPFVMLPGWSQTAVEWAAQIEAFRATHRVIALDLRGHGQSDKPAHGYRIARLAKDVRELMEALDLRDAVLMGHSLGATVLLGLYDLYGADRMSRLVIVDEPAWLFASPTLSEAEKLDAGASISAEALAGVMGALAGPDGDETRAGMLDAMFTGSADPAMVAAVKALNAAFPGPHAATLIFSNVTQDFRDIYPRIAVPTLCIAGEASVVDQRTLAWQSRQIPNGRLAVFGADEGGGHFMFLENPQKFNAILGNFLGG